MTSTIRQPAESILDAQAPGVRAIDDIAFAAIVLGLASAPFWFGGNRPLAWGLHAIWFPGITVLYESGRFVGGRRHPVALGRIAIPAAGVALVALWAGAQIVGWIPVGAQHPLWGMAREALGRDLPGAISIDADETAMALVKFATAACLFWTTMQLSRSPRRARALVAAVAIIGAVYAAYGIIALLVFPETILWYSKISYNGYVTSTFVNRNSYAAYAGIGLMAAAAMAMRHFAAGERRGDPSVQRRIVAAIATAAGAGGAWLAAASVIVVALLLTASRGGVLSTLVGALALLAIAGLRGRKHGVGAGAGLLIALMLIAAIVFAFGDSFADRLASRGFASEERSAVYRLTLLSIADAPLLGSGWGTFREVLPMYRDSTLGPFGAWDFAHDSYLEGIQGLGVPAAAILLIAIAALAARVVHASLARSHSATAPMAASAATVVVSLHAFVDFSIQIQAVTLTWAALLAAGVAQSWSGRAMTDRETGRAVRPREKFAGPLSPARSEDSVGSFR